MGGLIIGCIIGWMLGNILGWWIIAPRIRPNNHPWNWRILFGGMFAYYRWLDRRN